MAWWNFWRERPVGVQPADDGFWQAFYGQENFAGEHIDAHGAMQLSAWWSGVRLISETVATLPIGIYERAANGDKRAVSSHPLYGILHDSPNADQTAVEFWEGRMLGLCGSGNGYAEKVEGAGGRLISLERMPADTIVSRTEAGALRYKFIDRGKEETLPEEKVFHIRGFGDGDVGMSPVSYARNTLGLAKATDRHAGQTFAKGGRAKGFFVMPPTAKPLTPDQKTDAKKNLVDANAGPNAPWAGILEGGVNFQNVTMSSRDAELILSRRFNVEDICRWLRIPPILIGHSAEGQTMWGTGVEQIILSWLMTGLRTYLVRVEQAMKKRLLSPADRARGLFVEFAVEGMLRADSAARAELMSKMVQNAALMPNEWRRKENLPAVEGGDQLFINSTLVPITQAGQPRATAAAAAVPEDTQ